MYHVSQKTDTLLNYANVIMHHINYKHQIVLFEQFQHLLLITHSSNVLIYLKTFS